MTRRFYRHRELGFNLNFSQLFKLKIPVDVVFEKRELINFLVKELEAERIRSAVQDRGWSDYKIHSVKEEEFKGSYKTWSVSIDFYSFEKVN